MILYIAEKPSLGRAIADVLPKPHKKEDGCIRAANGDVVSWCFGHLLELAQPDEYDPVFKAWRMEHLPILPDQWLLKPKTKTRKQIALLRRLTKEADQIVHAGDPDREGQLLVDEIISYLKVPNYKRDAMKRCLISDLNPNAVKKSLAQLRENREFIPLSTSALARSRADWIYGINLTRAYTLQGRRAGYRGVLSVGRVQTPVLGLVVRRDLAIDEFVSKPFYEVVAHLQTNNGETFTAKWQPSEACQKWQDEEGRVLSKALAENVVSRIQNQPCTVTDLEKKPKRNAPPLPYNLSALQIDANKRFGLSAQEVLDTCQALYERHKLITYPRSDCRYLPEEHFSEACSVVAAVNIHCSELAKVSGQLDLSRKGKAWNDKKVEAHHAIIPTSKKTDFSRLSQYEKNVYELVARQYLAQFMLDYRYNETKVSVEIAGGLFKSTSKQLLELGWKQLFTSQQGQVDDNGGSNEREEVGKLLPDLTVGEILSCTAGKLMEKMTQPPKHFTDATLLAAMTGIARYVEDSEVKKVLKETDGLGTEATRAGIIELLFKRGFLVRIGKAIHSTEAGRALISSLPDASTKPDMTAQWEVTLDEISHRKQTYDYFIDGLTGQLKSLIDYAATMDTSSLKALPETPITKGKRKTYRKKQTSKDKSRSPGKSKNARRT
jgi:DNA topoisomerase-3